MEEGQPSSEEVKEIVQTEESKSEEAKEEPKTELKKEKRGWFSFKKKHKEQKITQDEPKPEKKSKKEHKKDKLRIGLKIKNRLSNYRRVIEVARKPDKEEYLSSAKITGIGIAALGIIGFVLFLIFALV